MLPSLFVAHGAPSLAIEQHAYTEFLRRLGKELPRPKAIVIFSAHWESKIQLVSSRILYDTMYDFYGFPDELYNISYPAQGDVSLSLDIQQLFSAEGIKCELNDHRGLDHGAWAPLYLMYPQADISVVALSVNPGLSPEEYYRIGKALEPLREKDVLIIGSGGTVHNLQRLDLHGGEPKKWAVTFDEWLGEQLETWNTDALFDYESRAPHAYDAVPTTEHFIPLLLSFGAADKSHKAKLLHQSYQMGSLSLSCWAFGSTKINEEKPTLPE